MGKMTGIDFVILVVFALLVEAHALKGWSKEEDKELHRQLKFVNRPAVKSFKTDYGDVIDCVDIHQQLAFQHPLLKKHSIQLKPSAMPEEIKKEALTEERSMRLLPKISRCPQGSVPVKRATKKDLLMAKRLRPMHSPAYKSALNIPSGNHFAVLDYKGQVFGAKSVLQVWNISTLDDQYTVSAMWLSKGFHDLENNIQAGWLVHPRVFQAGVRLYILWTANGYQTACFNMLCPGFVQVSNDVYPGGQLSPLSTYDGKPYAMDIAIQKDETSGNWWFTLLGKPVGYWPKEILPGLEGGIERVSWGGEAFSPVTAPSPPMGSGHFPEEGFKKAALVHGIKVKPEQSKPEFVDPDEKVIDIYFDRSDCYRAIHNYQTGVWGRYLFYGGPGNCTYYS